MKNASARQKTPSKRASHHAKWDPRSAILKSGMARLSFLAFVGAVAKGDIKAVRSYLRDGANPNSRNGNGDPLLFDAVSQTGGLPIVRELLNAGAAVDQADKHGTTALILCARDESLDIVKELVKFGADVNAQNNDGDTPLTNAACWGSGKVVKFLLAHGADPHLADGESILAAELARQQGHRDIAEMIDRAA